MKRWVAGLLLIGIVGCGGPPSKTRLVFWKYSLMTAAARGNLANFKQCLARAPDVNAKDSGGTPVLDYAVAGGCYEIVELLVEKGANVNTLFGGKYRTTVLHNAARKGHNEMVALLVHKGANVTVKDGHGITPFHPAVRDCSKEIVDLLIAKGANLNAKDNDDATPLHYAVQNRHEDGKEIVALLIAEGSKVNTRAEEGDTPLDMLLPRFPTLIPGIVALEAAEVAREGLPPEIEYPDGNNRNEMVELLRKHGGKSGQEM